MESKKAACEDDGGTSYKVSRRARNIVQRRDIGSSCKGKASRMISLSFNSDDGDNRVNRGNSNIGGDSKDSEDTSADQCF